MRAYIWQLLKISRSVLDDVFASGADDATRMEIVASYYNFAPQGGWDNIEAYDIKKGDGAAAPDALADPLGFLGALFGSVGGDPMFVVAGTKR